MNCLPLIILGVFLFIYFTYIIHQAGKTNQVLKKELFNARRDYNQIKEKSWKSQPRVNGRWVKR